MVAKSKTHILVIEDEEDILELISYNLRKEGYEVTGISSGEAGLEQAEKIMPALVVLDLMLPGIDGFEVCLKLKRGQTTEHIPIIMLTAKGEEADIVTGLEMGADDYITKPFSPRILLARIKAVLRRKPKDKNTDPGKIISGPLTIDLERYEVAVSGESVSLTATEFRILQYIAESPGRVFTRDQIVNAIHESDFAVTDRAVDVQIVGLRKKLGKNDFLIETVRGVGYRFKEDP